MTLDPKVETLVEAAETALLHLSYMRAESAQEWRDLEDIRIR